MPGIAVRNIIVCADDAGWNEANDEVIACLGRARSITAISVLVDGPSAPAWRDYDAGAGCALGLHFNLTWTPNQGSAGLARVILSTHCGRMSRETLAQQFQRQITRFESLFSRPPDFVDGHQHVHMLPQIRTAMVDVLTRRYGSRGRVAVRVPLSHSWRGLKAAMLNTLGARALDAQLLNAEWPVNADFAGVYDMSGRSGYRRLMQAWLSTIRSRGLIMAHPGSEAVSEHAKARMHEYGYFAGSDWPQDRDDAGVRLIPFTADALNCE